MSRPFRPLQNTSYSSAVRDIEIEAILYDPYKLYGQYYLDINDRRLSDTRIELCLKVFEPSQKHLYITLVIVEMP